MKNFILIILAILFYLNSTVYSQIGSELIFNSNGLGITKFQSFKYQNFPQKQIYVQLAHSYNPPPPNSTGSFIKLNRQTNQWYTPYNGFLNSLWIFESFNQVWICNQVNDFVVSRYDTSVVIRHSRQLLSDCCGTEENKITSDAGMTYEPSIDISNTSKFCGLDIDSTDLFEAHYYYGYSDSIYLMVYTVGFLDQQEIAIVPNLKPSVDGGFLKVNPFNKDYIFTVSNEMMLSTNAGHNFFSINIPPVKKLVFSDADHSVYGYSPTKLYHSINNGLNWDSSNLSYDFNTIETNPDSSIILYGGSDNGLYKSVNKGINWFLYNNSFAESRNVIGISKDKNSGDTVFVSTDIAVYKVWSPFIVGINNISNEIPNRFFLAQNYPNPFNPATKIKFALPQDARGETRDVRLIIFDALGKEVTTLVNENLGAGSYEAEFNGSNFSSGIYFYKLEAGDFSEVKRMILLK